MSNGLFFMIVLLMLSVFSFLSADLMNETETTLKPTLESWEKFKARFGKIYRNASEENLRRSIRLRNVDLITAHNAEARRGKHRFTLRENSLTDLRPEEYQQLLGYRKSYVESSKKSRISRQTFPPYMPLYRNTVNVSTLPACVNWTAYGWVSPVKNQGLCGSCWSYSATGSLQAQYYNYSGKFVVLSEQNLIDCSYPQGNLGCNGGNMDNAFWYVQTNGIESISDYPDISSLLGSRKYNCSFNASRSVTSIASWREIEYGSELALQQAVAQVGPISAAIDAGLKTFQTYGGGIYSSPYCGSDISSLNHAVLVVGYGELDGQPYWLIQNSWGTSWGINGYMMLARNAGNMCGLATAASFPVISQGSSVKFGTSPSSACPTSQSSQNTATSSTSNPGDSLIYSGNTAATIRISQIFLFSILIALM